jgi:hypothetical protein
MYCSQHMVHVLQPAHGTCTAASTWYMYCGPHVYWGPQVIHVLRYRAELREARCQPLVLTTYMYCCTWVNLGRPTSLRGTAVHGWTEDGLRLLVLHVLMYMGELRAATCVTNLLQPRYLMSSCHILFHSFILLWGKQVSKKYYKLTKGY